MLRWKIGNGPRESDVETTRKDDVPGSAICMRACFPRQHQRLCMVVTYGVRSMVVERRVELSRAFELDDGK